MAYKLKHDEYSEKLEPLFKKVSELAACKVDVSEEEERIVYEELLNTIYELKNDSIFLKILAVIEKQDIEDFYNDLKSSKNSWNWAWGDWIEKIEDFEYDLEGKFEFRFYGKEKIYNLNGGTLETVRIPNKNYDLKITLHNVGSIKISREKKKSSRIQVEIIDTYGDKIAEWEEFARTRKVGLTRIDLGCYQYKYIK
ncbi:hypothetical protein [Bacillus sp. H1m]|uniref:hypothetical protein n=1 Tax=Bacillus sp. H1m TaxID=1397277 RepID=UPI00046AC1F6|nr:hypothetical protein [Bacillus sp. H1m]